jgi:hypothetical protein
VSEVDQLDDAVHHRVAKRDEGVDRSVRDAEGKDLDEERKPALGDLVGHQRDDRRQDDEADAAEDPAETRVAEGRPGPEQSSVQISSSGIRKERAAAPPSPDVASGDRTRLSSPSWPRAA